MASTILKAKVRQKVVTTQAEETQFLANFSPVQGDSYISTVSDCAVLKVYDGSQWVDSEVDLSNKLDANGLSTDESSSWSYSPVQTTKIKRNSETILNLNTEDNVAGYFNESGWHISPNVINSSQSFSDTNANVYLKSTSTDGVVGVATQKNLPQNEVFMEATFEGDGVHFTSGGAGQAATLDITRDSVKRNDKTETWENILDAPSKIATNQKSLDNLATTIDDLSISLESEDNTYYPPRTDEGFEAANNTILGNGNIVGSMGFKLTESNFHYGCLGLFALKQEISENILDQIATMTYERYGSVQDFTVIDYAVGLHIETLGVRTAIISVLTQEAPYLYSDDMYSFSKITFKDADGVEIAVMQPETGKPADLVQWYGCVTQWTKTPSTNINDYVEIESPYYMPKAENIGAFYYVDVPTDVITMALTNEPTCIKLDANYDSGLRQNYVDWGDDGTLTTAIADQCLKANYTVGENFLTLTLKKNKRAGQGLEQKPTFGTYSNIRFPDHPEIGNVVVGGGCNNVFGGTVKGLFDFCFASGYNDTSIGRYSVTGGTRNTAVYAGVALGNHNIVLGQSGFAAGATNFISRSGSNGVALGSENVLNGKNNVAGGSANNVTGLYSVAFGYGNKVKGDNGIALGYNNNQSNDLEFAVGLGNTLTGEGSMTLGRANQAYGNYNVCVGYGNVTNNAVYSTTIGHVNHGYGNYSFIAGNNNTCYSDASGAIGLNLKVNVSSDKGIYGNSGHLVGGSTNVINGGRNLIVGGQSNTVTLHDSIVIGNNLKENTKGFGKAIFGNFNDDTSYASIVLGAGSNDSARKNVFEVFNDGAVKTPNARTYKTDGTDDKRLTTKEYVDNIVTDKLDKGNFSMSSDGNTLIANTVGTKICGKVFYKYTIAGYTDDADNFLPTEDDGSTDFVWDWESWGFSDINEAAEFLHDYGEINWMPWPIIRQSPNVPTYGTDKSSWIIDVYYYDYSDNNSCSYTSFLVTFYTSGTNKGKIKLDEAYCQFLIPSYTTKLADVGNVVTTTNEWQDMRVGYDKVEAIECTIISGKYSYQLSYCVPINDSDSLYENVDLVRYNAAGAQTGALKYVRTMHYDSQDLYIYEGGWAILVNHPTLAPIPASGSGIIPYTRYADNLYDGLVLLYNASWSTDANAVFPTIGGINHSSFPSDVSKIVVSFEQGTNAFFPKRYDKVLRTYVYGDPTNYYTYIEHPDGTKECEIQVCVNNLSIGSAWGNCYEGSLGSFSFKSGFFTDTPQMTYEVSNSNGGGWIEGGIQPSSTSTGTLYLVRPSGATLTVARVIIKARQVQV